MFHTNVSYFGRFIICKHIFDRVYLKVKVVLTHLKSLSEVFTLINTFYFGNFIILFVLFIYYRLTKLFLTHFLHIYEKFVSLVQSEY